MLDVFEGVLSLILIVSFIILYYVTKLFIFLKKYLNK